MAEIQPDLSQYYAAKALFETVLGRAAFASVKDYGSLQDWRRNYITLIRAISVAVDVTVQVVDAAWKEEVADLLGRGVERVTGAKTIDEIHAAAAATLGELAFLQLGFVPMGRYRIDRVSLNRRNWRMDPVRTVQYVQSAEQRSTQERLLKSRGKSRKA